MSPPGWLDRLLKPPRPAYAAPATPSGLRAWRPTLGGVHARVHLRHEPDGTALALINASSAVRLTASGAAMTPLILDGEPDAAIVKALSRAFDAAAPTLAKDVAELRATYERLAAAPGGSYPIEDLTDGRGARASALSAPLEAWVEVGDDVTDVIDALWDAAVPHATLLAADDTPGDALVRAVERAEDLGMICGLRAVASDLPEETLSRCADAGLDCVQLPLAAVDAAEHDALFGDGDHDAVLSRFARCAALEVYALAEVPLLPGNADELVPLASFAASHDVRTLALWALVRADDEPAAVLPATALIQLGTDAEVVSESGDAHVLWSPPVRADDRPLLDQLRDGPRSAGDAAIRVTRDRAVLPARGSIAAGTLGKDAWPAIWSHSAFTTLRTELADTLLCDHSDLALCSTECVLDDSMWAARRTS